eukprot:SAG11_NODE_9897_length_871_cov_1.648964_2_plen_85_part_01
MQLTGVVRLLGGAADRLLTTSDGQTALDLAPAGGSVWPLLVVLPSVAEQHAFLDAAKAYDFATVRALLDQDSSYANVQPGGRAAP